MSARSRSPRARTPAKLSTRDDAVPTQVILALFRWLDGHLFLRQFDATRGNIYYDNQLRRNCRQDSHLDLNEENLKHVLSVGGRFLDVRWVYRPDHDEKELAFSRLEGNVAEKHRLEEVRKNLKTYTGISESIELKLQKPAREVFKPSATDYAVALVPPQIELDAKASPETNARRRMERAEKREQEEVVLNKHKKAMQAWWQAHEDIKIQLAVAVAIVGQLKESFSKAARTLDDFIQHTYEVTRRALDYVTKAQVSKVVNTFLEEFPDWIMTKDFPKSFGSGMNRLVRVNGRIRLKSIHDVLEKRQSALVKPELELTSSLVTYPLI